MDTFLTPIIAKKLKYFRKEKKWLQEIVAKHLKISQSAYTRMEKGICNSWLLHIEDICTLYQIDLSNFLKIAPQKTHQKKLLMLRKFV